MTPAKQQELFDKYPQLFELALTLESRQPIAWGISCQNGWFQIIDMLCETLETMLNERNRRRKMAKLEESPHTLRIVQIKEKFGTMRFYVQGIPSDITTGINSFSAVISFAEKMTQTVCELCGSPGTLDETGGWWTTECESCRTPRKAQNASPQPVENSNE